MADDFEDVAPPQPADPFEDTQPPKTEYGPEQVGQRMAKDVFQGQFTSRNGQTVGHRPETDLNSVNGFINQHVGIGELKDAWAKNNPDKTFDEQAFRRGFHQQYTNDAMQEISGQPLPYWRKLQSELSKNVTFGFSRATENELYLTARKRLEAGTATSKDMAVLSDLEQIRTGESQRGLPQKLAGAAASVPAMFYGGIPLIASGGTAQGASARAIEQGGSSVSPENIIPAAVQNVAMAKIASLVPGAGATLTNPLAKVAAGALKGTAEMQALASGESIADKFLPERYQFKSGGGAAGALANGDYGKAGEQLLTDLVTMGGLSATHAFAGVHTGGQVDWLNPEMQKYAEQAMKNKPNGTEFERVQEAYRLKNEGEKTAPTPPAGVNKLAQKSLTTNEPGKATGTGPSAEQLQAGELARPGLGQGETKLPPGQPVAEGRISEPPVQPSARANIDESGRIVADNSFRAAQDARRSAGNVPDSPDTSPEANARLLAQMVDRTQPAGPNRTEAPPPRPPQSPADQRTAALERPGGAKTAEPEPIKAAPEPAKQPVSFDILTQVANQLGINAKQRPAALEKEIRATALGSAILDAAAAPPTPGQNKSVIRPGSGRKPFEPLPPADDAGGASPALVPPKGPVGPAEPKSLTEARRNLERVSSSRAKADVGDMQATKPAMTLEALRKRIADKDAFARAEQRKQIVDAPPEATRLLRPEKPKPPTVEDIPLTIARNDIVAAVEAVKKKGVEVKEDGNVIAKRIQRMVDANQITDRAGWDAFKEAKAVEFPGGKRVERAADRLAEAIINRRKATLEAKSVESPVDAQARIKKENSPRFAKANERQAILDEAKAAGHNLDDLQGQAKDLMAQDAAQVQIHNEKIKDVEAAFPNAQKWKARRLIGQEVDEVRGADEVSSSGVAERYPDLQDYSNVVDFIKNAKQRQPMSENEALRQAAAQMEEYRANQEAVRSGESESAIAETLSRAEEDASAEAGREPGVDPDSEPKPPSGTAGPGRGADDVPFRTEQPPSDGLREWAQAAKKRGWDRLKKFGSGERPMSIGDVDADMIKGLVEVVSGTLVEGAYKFADFARDAVELYGERIRPHLEVIYKEATGSIPKEPAAPVEPPKPSGPTAKPSESPRGEPTGIKNEQANIERAKVGLHPLAETDPVGHSFPELIDKVNAINAADPLAIDRLVDSMTKNPRPATDLEVAQLLHRENSINRQWEDSEHQMNAANRKGDTVAAAEAAQAADFNRQRLKEITDLTKKIGADNARGLSARQMMVNQDFTLAAMERQAEAAKGRPLSDPERAALVEANKKIRELQDKVDALGNERTPAGEDMRFKLQQARKTFTDSLAADRNANQTVTQKVIRHGKDALDMTRAIMTAYDLSAVFKQGGFTTYAHPIISAKALWPSIRAFASKAYADRSEFDIERRPNAPMYDRAGLFLAGRGEGVNGREEAFMSKMADRIPGVAGSERAYRTFLNRVRADAFDAAAAGWAYRGRATIEQAKVIANLINVATGRGTNVFGTKDSTWSDAAKLFFAPRFVVSRMQLAIGQPFIGGDLRSKAWVASEYARALAGVGVFYGLAALVKTKDYEWNAESSDAGKVVIGNTRIDPLAGVAQAATFATRMWTGKTKSTTSGQVKELDSGKFGSETSGDVIKRFVRSKLAPVPGALWDLKEGKNVVGEKVNVVPHTWDELAGGKAVTTRLVTPLVVSDVYEAMKDQGVPKGAALGLLAILGMGMQTYEKKK